MSHSPEPWTAAFDGDNISICSGDKIILTLKKGAIYGGQQYDAARLVACVNACRGITTETLTSMPLGGLHAAFEDYTP